MSKFYYAVKEGKNPGIYNTWDECEKEVKGFKGAKYKKFKTKEEALNFIGDINIVENKSLVSIDGEHDLEALKENEAIAYVDGSFDLDTFTYSYGVVFLSKDGKETFNDRENNKELAEMRNVSGELRGAMAAMELALEKNMETLYLHYDYMGIEEWARGNWKTNKDGTKAYKDYYDSIKDRLNVVFVKVLAHSGVKYNEEADQLAKEALL